MTALFTRMPSPVGDLLLAGDARDLSAVWIDGQRWAPEVGADWRESAEPFREARRQLTEYFAGERTMFELSLRPSAARRFNVRCGSALQRIPYGETRTYGGGWPHALGEARAARRAVGAANGQNPILPSSFPCHRLIGTAARGLVDYAAGVAVKRWPAGPRSRPRQRSGPRVRRGVGVRPWACLSTRS